MSLVPRPPFSDPFMEILSNQFGKRNFVSLVLIFIFIFAKSTKNILMKQLHAPPVPCSLLCWSLFFFFSVGSSPFTAAFLVFLLRCLLGLETGDAPSLQRSSFSFSPSKSGDSCSSSSSSSSSSSLSFFLAFFF